MIKLECVMIKLNENIEPNIKLIKNYIKDLSFENPQTVNENNAENNNNNNIVSNIKFIHEPFKNNFFSVIIKYSCECSSKKGLKLFVLELDYFGFFKILDDKSYNQVELTKCGAKLILPFVKSIIENVSKEGGSVGITIENIDLELLKI